MCFSGLFGKKKSTSTSTTTALPGVMQNYNYINELAKTAATKPFQKYGTQASDFVAQVNPQQTMGISGINASVNAYQPYFQNATAATQAGMGPAYEGIQNYMSPYIKNVADTTGALMKQQFEQAQSGALGTAASSGAFGGDRAGIAAANMQQQNQLGYGKTMADIYNQGYTQALGASQADLARQLQGGAQMAGLGAQSQQLGLAGGQAQIAAGSLQQQTEQAGKDALINQFMQEQGYPFQTAQFLANIYSMTGPGAGSTTTNVQPGSFWSDRRLKHDVERIGHTDDGQPIYRFKYNGSNQTQIGLMADQVEKHHPDAVGTDPKTGYKYVDYDRATQHMAKGGVAGPYQIEIGATPGAGGYMPENYVKPSEMLLPDAEWLASVNQSAADRKTGLQDLIDNIGRIKDTYNQFAGEYQPKATGGSVDEKKTLQERGYLQPILDAMAEKNNQGLVGAQMASGTTSSGSGGGSGIVDTVGKIVDVAGKVKNFFGWEQGGAVGDRHGYALDGGVSYPAYNTADLRKALQARDQLGDGVDIINDLNKDALMRAPTNPANMGLAGHQAPPLHGIIPANNVPPLTARQTPLPSGPEEAWDIPGATNRFPHRGEPTAPDYPIPPTTSPFPQPGVAGREAIALASMRPPRRPADLGTPVVPVPTVTEQSSATGVIPHLHPDQQPNRGIPLLTQGAYALSEPEMARYASQKYGSPEDAAYFASKKYEGNMELIGSAQQNAHRIYDAIQKGGEGLAPNELALYDQFKKSGQLDDVQIAGLLGRFNVEAGAGINPNARNEIGGGHGTYGIMQARGPRFENLAKAGGLSTEQLEAMPVTNGLSSGAPGVAQVPGGVVGQEPSMEKPYSERNLLGQIFHNPDDGRLNKDAVMSLLSGVGTMLASPSQYFLPTLGAGLAAGANTYMAREGQRADITAQNLENLRNLQMDAMTYNEMNGTNLTAQQYASMIGAGYKLPTGIGQPASGEKMTWGQYQNGVTQVGGRTVKMQDDPVSIQRFISDNSMYASNTPIGKQVDEARQHLADINVSGGMTIDANGEQFQIPGYTNVADVQAKTVADQAAAAKFREDAQTAINSSAQQLAAVSTLENVYSKMEPGKFTNVGAEASAILSALDPNNVTGWNKYDLTDPAQYEIAMKGAGEIMATRLRSMPGGAPAAEIDMLSSVTPTPNMQPEAVKKLLAITKADAKYRLDMYNNYDPAVHGNDVNSYMKKFANSGKTFTRYVEEAMASMPRFAGEGIDPSAAEAELIKRGYVRNSEGKLVKP